MSLKLQMRFKIDFFDAPKVVRAVDRGTRRALTRAGAFVRTRARSIIRKRKRVSQPGQPPSSHAGHLKRLLYFSYDATGPRVLIGPVRFREGEAPNLLEFGGTVVRRDWQTKRRRRLHYRARPFMGPALAAEAANLPKCWRNSVRGN